MRSVRLVPSLVALGVLAGGAPARAEDEPRDGPTAAVPARIDLGDLRVSAAALGPRLYAPSDASFPGFDEPEVASETFLAKFQEPPYPTHAFSLDLVEDLVKRLVPDVAEGSASIRLFGDALDVWASPATAERARTVAREVAARLAPRLAVSATLTDGTSLLAAGGVALAPRRWTPLWFRRDVRRVLVGFQAEVATESVANHPTVTALPEGTECYVRWSPGERVSLVELWLGALESAGETEVDLSAVRNIPETNSMGTARLPRTGVRRAATTVAVPVGEAGEAVVSLATGGKPLTLRLAVAAEPARDPADPKAPGGTYGVLRLAALGAPLDGGGRPSRLDEALRRLQAVDARTAGGAEGRGAEMFAQALAGVEGPAPRLARLRADVAAEEERLARAVLELRVAPVPAEGLAEALASGRLAVGRVLAPDAVPAGEPWNAVRLPLVSGVAASARAGTSITGFAELPVSLAERAGGIAAVPVGRFDGLAATARATRGADGSWTLALEGDLSWAKADGARASLAFRAPLAMAYRNYNKDPEDASVRRVEVPLLTEGRNAVESSVRWTPAEFEGGRSVLLAVLSRPTPSGAAGTQTALLIATLRR
jgi:hypothetical protein